MIEVIKNYYPNATEEDIIQIANDFADHGCGFVTVATLFTLYMDELDSTGAIFKDKFGYDLYFSEAVEDYSTRIYNIETLALDFFLYRHLQAPYNADTIEKLHQRAASLYDTTGRAYAPGRWINDKLVKPILEDAKDFFGKKGIIVTGNTTNIGGGLGSQISLLRNIQEHTNEYTFFSSADFKIEGTESEDPFEDIEFGHYMNILGIDEEGHIKIQTWNNEYNYYSKANTRDLYFTTIKFELAPETQIN